MNILVTGGAGFIGSHTCVALILSGYKIIIVDNFNNSHPKVIERIKMITGQNIRLEVGSIIDSTFLSDVFERHKPEAVIHFAGLKSVGESAKYPINYYEQNITGTLNLIRIMKAHRVKKIIFSSTATVYGQPLYLPYDEKHILNPQNVYGRSKQYAESLLCDQYSAHNDWSICILRYFNPVGAHKSGLIGENPLGIPNNLMPQISKVAMGELSHLTVLGDNYDTKDGTGIRDYIHVCDLADGHVNALDITNKSGLNIINLGCGKGYSVLEIIKEFENISGKKIKYKIGARREGDIGISYADPSTAKKILGWEAKNTLADMCRDMWNFQIKNPHGYF